MSDERGCKKWEWESVHRILWPLVSTTATCQDPWVDGKDPRSSVMTSCLCWQLHEVEERSHATLLASAGGVAMRILLKQADRVTYKPILCVCVCACRQSIFREVYWCSFIDTKKQTQMLTSNIRWYNWNLEIMWTCTTISNLFVFVRSKLLGKTVKYYNMKQPFSVCACDSPPASRADLSKRSARLKVCFSHRLICRLACWSSWCETLLKLIWRDSVFFSAVLCTSSLSPGRWRILGRTHTIVTNYISAYD